MTVNTIKTLYAIIAVLLASCGTVDVQANKIREIREHNKKLGNYTPAVFITGEDADKREMELREANTNIIIMRDEIFVPVEPQVQKPLSRDQVVQRSM